MSTAAKHRRFTLRSLCPQCVKLQEEVKRLREEKRRLETQLRYQQRKIDEGYFGSSTPLPRSRSISAPKLRTSMAVHASDIQGLGQGRQGHGRAAISAQEVSQGGIIPIDTEHLCPDCRVPLVSLNRRDCTVTEVLRKRQ